MKTILELNNRWWYRFIKVVYFFLLIISLIAPTAIIISDSTPGIDQENSYAKCKDGRAINLSKNNIYLYSESASFYDDEAIKQRCVSSFTLEEIADGHSDDEIIDRILANWDRVYDVDGALKAGASKKDIITYLKTQINENTKYNLVVIYENRDWSAVIGYSLLSLVAALLFFEIIRRVFYYVILGSIRPQKTERVG